MAIKRGMAPSAAALWVWVTSVSHSGASSAAQSCRLLLPNTTPVVMRASVCIAPASHSVAALGAIPRLMAINSALEVDLFGQVNAERAGGVFQAGAGGLPAFAHGALNSPGGHLFICLGATARQGTVSRIVPSLGAQGLCTLPRSMADVVVTEHGAAQIRHLSLDARAQALIGIAAPEHRHALANDWDELMRKA